MTEYAYTFQSQECELLSIIHQANNAASVGVLVIVGGPQYRAGSHRQFVQLSRFLSRNGVSSMRFDYTGMGDSLGDKKSFEQICSDIKSAVDTFLTQQPQLEKVVIWGLCDAASAAAIYAHQDNRIRGLVLLNPWLRSDKAMGKTMVKYYYLQRLMSKSFWRKLFSGKFNFLASARDAKGFVQDSFAAQTEEQESYQQRMKQGIQNFSGKLCLILSGEDLTAREFDEQTGVNQEWANLRAGENEIHKLDGADHTFSSSKFKQGVERITLDFVLSVSK